MPQSPHELVTAAEVVELEIPARAEFVALARLVVSALATSDTLLPDERIDDLKIAVSEACTNAIEAHGAVDTDERVLVRCRTHHDCLEVHIEDRGDGLRPARRFPTILLSPTPTV